MHNNPVHNVNYLQNVKELSLTLLGSMLMLIYAKLLVFFFHLCFKNRLLGIQCTIECPIIYSTSFSMWECVRVVDPAPNRFDTRMDPLKDDVPIVYTKSFTCLNWKLISFPAIHTVWLATYSQTVSVHYKVQWCPNFRVYRNFEKNCSRRNFNYCT